MKKNLLLIPLVVVLLPGSIAVDTPWTGSFS